MSSPALKDLPKVAVDLKSQLEGFSTEKLKNIDTQEKIVLPTAEGKCFDDTHTHARQRVPSGSRVRVNCETELALVFLMCVCGLVGLSEVHGCVGRHKYICHQRQCL